MVNVTSENEDNGDQERTESICMLQFSLPNELNPPVLFYYRLTNFYQNHRRYVQSQDEQQLKGEVRTKSQLDSSDDCSPLIANKDGKPYYPCGLIANSMFNDSFTSPLLLNAAGGSTAKNEPYPMTNKGIAWDSDRSRYGKTKYTVDDVVPPPNWVEKYGEKYEELPDLGDWEEFHVWMRTAGLPTFSKLALRNDDDIMQKGTYQVNITYNFHVSEYAGTKSIVISTRTVMGGKNPFLGIAYIVVAGICVLLGALFTARHVYKPRYAFPHQRKTKLYMTESDPSPRFAENSVIILISHGTTTNPQPPIDRASPIIEIERGKGENQI